MLSVWKGLSLTKARKDGLYLLVLGSLVFVVLGIALESSLSISMVDFRVPYYCTRCFLEHCDPYKPESVIRVYNLDGGGDRISDAIMNHPSGARFMYLPTLFSLTTPIALLPYRPAHIIWMALSFGGLVIASFLLWYVAADHAPVVSGFLIGFMLANSELLTIIGNPAGIAISCCIVAAWCFVRIKLVQVGIVCLAIALIVKPHDSGLVWIYFLFAGQPYRKWAVQTFALAILISLPAILWITHTQPNWAAEMRSIVALDSARGAVNDPGPTSAGAHRLGMMVNLQTAVSDLWDDPRFYNPVTYAICGSLLLGWIIITILSKPSATTAWLALATISALTMLPIYHRQLDTKLLILSVPACAMLYAERGRAGRIALPITVAAFACNGDIPWLVVLSTISHLSIPNTAFFRQLVIAIQVVPAPLSLLAMSIFYLWVYAARAMRLGQLRTETHPDSVDQLEGPPSKMLFGAM
jgi:hypothetical protein